MAHNQQNLSPGTAYARFMLGSVMTAYGTVRLLREPKSRSGRMLVLFGSMKVAEGATKFCPRKAMSTIMEKMMSENATQSAQTNAGTTMSSGTQSKQNTLGSSAGQMNGNIMQMVGNIAQTLTGGSSAQNASGSMGGNQNSSGAGQNAMGTNAQTIGNIAQTVVPQVSQMVKNVAGMTGSQMASGTNNGGKQASASSGTTNKNTDANGNANKKNASPNSENTKSASDTNSKNKQTASMKGSNTAKSDTKSQLDGAATDSNIDPSIIDAISKSGQKNTSTPNILQ